MGSHKASAGYCLTKCRFRQCLRKYLLPVVCPAKPEYFPKLPPRIISFIKVRPRHSSTGTINNSSSVSPVDDKTGSKSNKKSHTIAIPKLDFSDILDYYENTPVFIKKIKIRKNKNKKNGDNLKYSDKNINKGHHYKHYSHSVIKE